MPKTDWTFQNLLHACTTHANALNPVSLHGFLTAIAIGPEDVDDNPIFSTVYGFTVVDKIENYLELGELVWDAIDEIAEDLADSTFEAVLHMDGDSPEDPALWMEGFNRAVALNEKAWEALNEEYPEAVKKFAFIQSFTGPDTANGMLGIPPEEYAAYLTEALPLFSQAFPSLYFDYWGGPIEFPIDSIEGTPDFSLDDLPTFSPEELQQQSDEELLFNILNHSDLLPREVVDEAIRRGQSIAGLLRRHLEDPANWGEDVDADDWWGLLHAIFILGHITGEDATHGLLHAIRHMDGERDNDLWDWLANHWPALFRNKRATASEGLQGIADDRNLDWYPRATALECLLEAAHAARPDELDAMLQRISRSVADETEDWDYRLSACHHLLDFPRDTHRPVLEKLAAEQEQREEYPHYRMSEVDDAYHLREDKPEWERFGDPLAFYEPENILSRQIRWAEEDEFPMEDYPLFEEPDDLPNFYDQPPPITYVRETPKVGRNDPCPCGSGKKYKKCCLKKLH
ncbi:MAG: UPF0149 family protein [Pseudomonadota bacterium]